MHDFLSSNRWLETLLCGGVDKEAHAQRDERGDPTDRGPKKEVGSGDSDKIRGQIPFDERRNGDEGGQQERTRRQEDDFKLVLCELQHPASC